MIWCGRIGERKQMNIQGRLKQIFATGAAFVTSSLPFASTNGNAQTQQFFKDVAAVHAQGVESNTQRGEVVEFNANSGDTTGGDSAFQKRWAIEKEANEYSTRGDGVAFVVYRGASDSARSDDEIRALMDKKVLKDFNAPYKIYIINNLDVDGSGVTALVGGISHAKRAMSLADMRKHLPVIEIRYNRYVQARASVDNVSPAAD